MFSKVLSTTNLKITCSLTFSLDNTDWFLYVKPSLHSWVEVLLAMVVDVFNVSLDLICKYLIEFFFFFLKGQSNSEISFISTLILCPTSMHHHWELHFKTLILRMKTHLLFRVFVHNENWFTVTFLCWLFMLLLYRLTIAS